MSSETEYQCDICYSKVQEGCDGVAFDEEKQEWTSKFDPSPYYRHICKTCLIDAGIVMDQVQGIKR